MTNLADELERLAKRCAEIDAHYARYPNTLERTAEQHAADIRSLVSALRREEWQGIETAPKDESVVLLAYAPNRRMDLSGMRRVYEGRWHAGQATWTSVNGFIVHLSLIHI